MNKKPSPENAQTDISEAESEAAEIEVVEEKEETADTDSPALKERPIQQEIIAEKKSGLPLMLGGAVAAVLGFGVAQIVPDGWPLAGADNSEIEAKIEAQSKEIDTLKQLLDAQTGTLANKVDHEKHTDDLATLSSLGEQGLADANLEIELLQKRIEEVSLRLTDVEKQPIADNEASSAAVAAYERELTAMRETLAAQKTQIESVAKDAEAKIAAAKSQAEDLQAGAAATANAALLRAGLSHINSAIEGGGTFEAALVDLTKATGIEPTAQLQTASVSGVATLTDLRRTFPDAARAALSAATLEPQDQSATSRLGAFLRSQTGARSLKPREGSDPDAVLSRAEAAVREGNLEAALQEISTLPKDSQEAVADWVSAALYRLETQAAIQSFVSSLSEN